MQLPALKNAGCRTVFKHDGLSGATTKRPALLRCLKKLDHGDTLIVWKLDRDLCERRFRHRDLISLVTPLSGVRRPRGAKMLLFNGPSAMVRIQAMFSV